MFKKTILIIISKDIMRRNILTDSFWRPFIDNKDNTKIVLLVEGGKENTYSSYKAENVEIVGIQKEKITFFHKLVIFLIRTGLYSHGVTLYRWRSLALKESGLAFTLLKTFLSSFLGRFTLYKKFVRFLYGRLRLDWIEEVFEEHKPDLVFAPSLIDVNVDALVAASARRRKIKVIGMVRSWDNLVIHGLLPLFPDKFLFQNKWLKYSAEKFQSLDLKNIEYDIVGLPHYDAYKHPERIVKTREEFLGDMLSLDPNKKLIFLAGFDFYYSEDVLPALLEKAIEKGDIKDKNGVQILFTQHPRSPFKEEDYHIGGMKHVKYLNLFRNKESLFSNTEETFINIAYHADVIINAASTVAIDAAVFDRPVICVSFDDPHKKLPYWKRARRLHDSFDHYEHLISTGGARVAKSEGELISYLNEYLRNPHLHQEGRKKIIDEFVAPFDGKTGERLAKILSEEITLLS